MAIRQTSYLNKALMPGEEALVEGRLHWVCYLNTWGLVLAGCVLLAAALYLPPCALGALFFFGWAFISWLKVTHTQLLITSKRVIFKEGIISIHTEELRNVKVESIEIFQPIMGRILGYATIHFAGTGNSDVYFHYVADPWRVKNSAEAIVSGEAF